MLYFAVGEYGYEGGVQVTASHNPKQYNGMKMVRRGAQPVGGDTGLGDVKRLAVDGPLPEPKRQGERSERDVLAGFADKALSFIDPGAVGNMRVVLDGANGMAGPMVEPLLGRLPIDAVTCFMDPDGSFPDHEPNPLLEENREFIVGKVRSESADLGIAWDGDADRCFFVDDTGEFVPGDLITALLAESMLEKNPGAKIIYDLRASWAVRDTVLRARRHRRSRTGSGMRSSRRGCARRTRSSPARCPATTTSATSTTATPASSRPWCCWS